MQKLQIFSELAKYFFFVSHFFRIFALEIPRRNMTKKQAIQLFEEKKVRTVWDDEKEE